MKKIFLLSYVLTLMLFVSCKRTNWAEGTLSPVKSVADIRSAYKGEELILNSSSLSGATKITGVVISDATAGNLPSGMIVIQQYLRKKTSGISLILPSGASDYTPGDSVVIDINGAVLKKVNGSLQIAGLPANAVQVVSKENALKPTTVTVAQLTANPAMYESTLVHIHAADFVPKPTPGVVFSGDKVFNDGTGSMPLHTEDDASFSADQLPESASLTGIPLIYQLDASQNVGLRLYARNRDDIKARSLIIAWNLLGAVGNELTSTSTVTNAALEVSVLSRGPGITAVAAGGSYASTFPINVDKAAAILAGAYYQFTIKPKVNVTIGLSALDAILRIQTSAPKTYIWTYSINGGATFNDIGTPYTWTTGFSDNNGIQQPQIDLSGIDDFQAITSDTPIIFRLYAWGGTSISSNNGFRIGKSLTAAQHALALEGIVY
jgi:hypothetical protein